MGDSGDTSKMVKALDFSGSDDLTKEVPSAAPEILSASVCLSPSELTNSVKRHLEF